MPQPLPTAQHQWLTQLGSKEQSRLTRTTVRKERKNKMNKARTTTGQTALKGSGKKMGARKEVTHMPEISTQ